MKKTAILALFTFFLIACSNTNSDGIPNKGDESLTPLEVVNKRMKFYNEHNFDEFIKLYHKDVKIYTYPKRLVGTGSDRLGPIFKEPFEDKSISVEIVSQMHNGSYVINHELVTHDGEVTKYVSIYEVEKGLITNVRFVR